MSDTKKSYYITRKDVVSSKENPWAGDLAHTIKKGGRIAGFATTNNHSLMDRRTGEISEDMAVIGVRKVIDREEFVKFFSAGIDGVFELAKGAKDLFRIILKAYLDAKNNPDQLYISYDAIVDDYEYSRSRATFTGSLNELCLKGFLAPVERRENLYWVNPNLFYKGDRMRIVQDYVLQGSEAHKQLDRELAGLDQRSLEI